MIEYIVFPSGYFNPRLVDEDLQNEYDSVMKSGLYKVALFGYDKWFNEGRLILNEVPEREVTALYRGWMMKPEQYSDFYSRLAAQNIRLITTPEQYERFHIFPNIYPRLKNDTAGIIVYPDGKVNLDEVKSRFSRFMVKDFVKSVKGTEFPKYFSSDVDEQEFNKAMEIFYKYRAGLYTGGICIKEYLDLRTYDGATNEYRVFVANNKIVSVCPSLPHSENAPEVPRELVMKYANLESPMYTVDFAELADGTWKIIEAGDGQVSGLYENQDYDSFFELLYKNFKN